MPRLSKKYFVQLLKFLDWENDGELWRHKRYQPEWGPAPDVHSPEATWWLLDWLLKRKINLRFHTSTNPLSRGNFVTAKDIFRQGVKWAIQDFPERCPNQALVSIILRIKRFPDGQPKGNRGLLQFYLKPDKPLEKQFLYYPSHEKLMNVEKKLRKIDKRLDKQGENNAVVDDQTNTEEVPEDISKEEL